MISGLVQSWVPTIFPPNCARFVEDVGLRRAEGAEAGVGGAGGVQDGEEGEWVALQVSLVCVKVLVEGDPDDLDLRELLLQRDKRGELHDAGRAPACPEV